MADEDDIGFRTVGPRLKEPPPEQRPQVGYAGDNAPTPGFSSIGGGSTNILQTSYPNGLLAGAERGLGLGTRYATEAIAQPLTGLADLASYPARLGLRLAGQDVTAPSDLFSKLLTKTGLPEPTPGENNSVAAQAIRGGAGMLTPMGIGALAPRAVAALPGWLQQIAATPVVSGPRAAGQTVAGGVGGAAGEIAASRPEIGDNWKPAVQMGANMAGAGLTSGLYGIGGTVVNAARGVQSQITQALQRLGINPGTAGAVTERPTIRSMEAGFSKGAISSDTMEPAQQHTIDQFDDAVRRHAMSFHPATTAEEAGTAVQRALHQWKDTTWRAEQDAAWTPLNQRLSGTAVDPAPYRRALEQTARDPALNSLPETQRAFANRTVQGWLNALETDVGRGASLSWEQAQAIKRNIGDLMGTPDIVDSIGGTALKRIYAGLAGAMERTATQHGQGRLFDEANQVTIDGHQFIAGTLGKAVQANNAGQELTRPDRAARALLTDNTAMQQLRERVPEAANALAAFMLHKVKEARPSSQTDMSTPSTGTFLTEMRKHQLLYPEGSRALLEPTGQATQTLRDLVAAASQLRRVEKNLNTSGTGDNLFWKTLLASPFAGYAMAGPIGAVGVPAGMVAGPYVAGKGLTSGPAIALAGAQRGQRLPFKGLLGGALSDFATMPVEKEDRR